mgnify:CR=1 FL=1
MITTLTRDQGAGAQRCELEGRPERTARSSKHLFQVRATLRTCLFADFVHGPRLRVRSEKDAHAAGSVLRSPTERGEFSGVPVWLSGRIQKTRGVVQWHGRPSQCRGFRPVPASPPSAALSRLQARQRDAVCLAGHVHSDSQGPTFRQQTRKVTWRGPIGHHATVAAAAVEVCSIPRLCATTQGLVQTPSAPTAQRCLGAVGED